MDDASADQLAKEGVVFTRGYVPSSLCRPSLMSILTGQYPHQHLVTGNDPPKGTDRAAMLRHIRRCAVLPRILADHGYACFQSGKWWEGNFAEGGFTAGMTHGDPARGATRDRWDQGKLVTIAQCVLITHHFAVHGGPHLG